MQIEKILVLSTGHICKETSECMDDSIAEKIIVIPHDHGWFVYAGIEKVEASKAPDDLKDALLLAQKHECVWLNLDCDGPECDELDFHDW